MKPNLKISFFLTKKAQLKFGIMHVNIRTEKKVEMLDFSIH